MSEVLVRGMEMPKNCTECKIKGEGSDSFYTWSCPFTGLEYTRYECVNDRLDDCPLVELPEHGELIDRDAYIAMMEEKCDHTKSLDEWILRVCRGGIKAMPVIVPAEGSE